MATEFQIAKLSYAPEDLLEQIPLTATLLRQIPGDDRPDYWLAKLKEPLRLDVSTGCRRRISHLVVSSRYEGTAISEQMKDLVIGIAYVIDDSLLDDESLSFDKCEYVAIGTATTTPEGEG